MNYGNDASEAERLAAYERRKRAIAEAWQAPISASIPPAPGPPQELACATAREAHERMIERMINAWRDPSDGRR